MSPLSQAELSDRALISETLQAYCDHVDTGEIDRVVGLFTEDACLDMGHGVHFRGRAELRAVLIDRLGRWTATNHHCSGVRLRDYDGRSATTVCTIYAYHEDAARDRRMHLWGRYLDELVPESEVWRIRVRRLRVAGVSESRFEPVPARLQRFAREPLPEPGARP